jgi:hypothetical protein
VKILIAFKNPKADNPSACHAGLGVTASNTSDSLREIGIDAEPLPVVDGYYLRDKLRQRADVGHVVLCAPFFDTSFLEALCREFQRIEFSVVFHSNVGFLGVDNWSIGVLGEQVALERRVDNFRVAGNSRKFCDAVIAAFQSPCALLPNLYFLHGPIERKRPLWSGGVLKIGAFGATRILKNLPTAAWAAQIISQRADAPVEFHVSVGREEGEGAISVIESVRRLYAHNDSTRLVQAPWQNWLDFRRITVRNMHLLMQPSYTESFNGVTADGIAEGVPSVVGHAIDWVPAKWIANADDAVEIAEVGLALLRDKNAARDGYRALVAHNESASIQWRRFIAG